MFSARKSWHFLVTAALFPTLGVGAGLGFGVLLTAKIAELEPHQALTRLAPDRVYIGMECRHSHRALAALDAAPGTRPVVVIPVDVEASPERDQMCRGAVALLKRNGSAWWGVLPEAYVCTRIAEGAQAWVQERIGDEFRVPAWVVRGELGVPGVSEETLALLRSEGLLAAGMSEATRTP
ncbi:hypothetical protein [Chondromyces crocatus]|uniref:Uncharacterized protein n=1 Tax=Chondromyces crocatus TaxID=52 RepID=A0A0K1EMA7_CHOCO|nr:hypothetical protein [Chondromyces crocatus]AKT42040.1 uncharacterized protein CMC5_062630 [Chondromyces crocatus]